MDIKEDQILSASANRHWYYVSKSKVIKILLKSLSERKILDVGAGSGVFAKFLLESNLAASARCVDTAYPFDDKLEIHNNKNITFVKSVENFDETVILMIDVLEHIEDDLGFLKHYVDRISVGSYVLISVPAFSFLWSGHDIFLEHKRRYTLSELEVLVKKSGLKVMQGRYYFGLLFPLITLIRLTNNILLRTGKLSAKSDLKRFPEFINKLLIHINYFEINTIFHFNRMAGLTVFCLARK